MRDLELFRKYFEYSSPSDMHNNFNKTIGSEENKAQVNVIKDMLAKLMEAVKRSPTIDEKKKLETNTKSKSKNFILFFVYIKCI